MLIPWCIAGDSEVQRTLLEIMNQLDGFEARGNVKARPAGGIETLALSQPGCSPGTTVDALQTVHSCLGAVHVAPPEQGTWDASVSAWPDALLAIPVQSL